MNTLRFTLLAEGSSDRVLIPIIRWMLLQHHSSYDWIGQLADLNVLLNPPKSLADRISATIAYFPSDILFVHRDADKNPVEKRIEEIRSAFAANHELDSIIWSPVIPVRMTEAWLLISETALRASVDNLGGSTPLDIPAIKTLEKIPNPKLLLEQKLVLASELTGRRKKKFFFPEHRSRIPDYIEDWNQLLELPSALRLYEDIRNLNFSPAAIISS
jgi:hypothetical protein